MIQNTSHAVMAQRIEPKDSLDHFPTPPWATRALCSWLDEKGYSKPGYFSVWEPACAEGHMSRALADHFASVYSSDIFDYGFGEIRDFLTSTQEINFDWIITNPPFKDAHVFALHALKSARLGVALLVRTAFLEGARRHRELFNLTPPSDILQFVERVPMFKGRLDPHGSTATAYCWLVWRRGSSGTRFHWLRPCRHAFERPDDYPVSEDVT